MIISGNEKDRGKLEEFYNALNESQKTRIEAKLKNMLRESYDSLPKSNVDLIRWQIAQDMFRIIKG